MDSTYLSPGGAGNFLSVPSPTIGSLGGETFAPSVAASSDSRLSVGGDMANDIINDEEALKPDPGTEDDFVVENNPFAFSPGQMSKMYNPKNHAAFHALGGLVGLEKGLRSDITSGLSLEEQSLSGSVSFDEATAVSNLSASTKGAPQYATPRYISLSQYLLTHLSQANS